MAVSKNTYTGDGSNKNFDFTFPYLQESDVKVRVNGVDKTLGTDYTFANATRIQFTKAPANTAVVIVYRNTDNSTKKATFYPGSAIKAEDLNDNIDQILYTVQEVDENALSSLGEGGVNDTDIKFEAGKGLEYDGTGSGKTRLIAGNPGSNIDVTVSTTAGTLVTSANSDNTIATANIANDAVNGDKIADNSINSEHYVDGSIDTDHIANDAVTFAKIKNISDTNKILGRQSAGAGDVEELSPANVRTMLSVPELTGSTDNTICTVTGANAIQGEANLTFQGGQLLVKGSDPNIRVRDEDGTDQQTYLKQAGSNFYIDTQNNDANGNFSIRGFNGTERTNHFKITAAGRCGIGSDDPGSLFTIKEPTTSGAKDILQIQSDGGGSFLVKCNDTAAANPGWQIRTYASEDIQISPGNNVVMHLDAADKFVGIGTTTPTNQLHIYDPSGSANNYPELKIESFRPTIKFKDRSSSTASSEICGDNSLIFRVSEHVADDAALTERMKITSAGNVLINDGDLYISTSGHGINFHNFGAGVSSNTLDDYEEGTWSPVVIDQAHGGAAGGTDNINTHTASGTYTKIGRKVTVQYFVQWGATAPAEPGILVITGLPFASYNSTARSPGTVMGKRLGSGSQFSSFSNTSVISYVDNQQSKINFWYHGPSGWDELNSLYNASNTNFAIYGNHTYFT